MDIEFKKLCGIIADVLGIDAAEITTDTTFEDDLGADSLDIAQIVMGIEEEFGLEVDLDSIGKITTVGEALDLIHGAVEA